MPSPRPPPAVLGDDWRSQRYKQTLALLDKLRDDERLAGDRRPYLDDATHAHAVELLLRALQACEECKITEKHDTASPVLWAVVLAQQAFVAVHREGKYWEQQTEEGARAPPFPAPPRRVCARTTAHRPARPLDPWRRLCALGGAHDARAAGSVQGAVRDCGTFAASDARPLCRSEGAPPSPSHLLPHRRLRGALTRSLGPAPRACGRLSMAAEPRARSASTSSATTSASRPR